MQLRLPWLRERLPLMALAGWDSLVAVGAYASLYRLRMGTWWGQNGQAAWLILGWVILSYHLGRYSKQSLQDPYRKFWRSQTAQVAVLLMVGIQLHSWLFRILMEATLFRGFLIPYIGIVASGSLAGQAVLRKRFRKNAKGWIIIASEYETKILKQELMNEIKNNKPNQLVKYIRTAEKLQNEVQHEDVEGVAISERMLNEHTITEILFKARGDGLDCCSLEDWCEKHLQRLPGEFINSKNILRSEGYQLKPGTLNWRIKRFGDVIVASTLIILTSPIVLISMLAVKMNDGGPFFYSQIRTGLYGRRIKIRKLRSMKTGAEDSGIQWAQRNDGRITQVGSWLRKFRIDELPQLWSVLSGDMSLIGPRPERPEIEQDLVEKLQNYPLRSWLRPGLSGWAQVCYPYGASEEDSRNKLSYDLYYLRNANLLLDILILIKTIRLVIGGLGSSPSDQTTTIADVGEQRTI